MTAQHKELEGSRWNAMPFLLQMANTASEVERSLNWQERKNERYFQKSVERAFELMDFTISDPKNRTRLREITRTRELLADYFFGENEYQTSALSWRSYFSKFTFIAQKNR